jgi:cytoplasmic iron level regulating protein YaaA (DUF328/UPF0246 family)
MLFLLSPAKTQREGAGAGVPTSEPELAAEASRVASALGALSVAALRGLLSLSAPLGALAAARAAAWHAAPRAPAAFTFDGPAYRALDMPSLDPAELAYVARALLIVCPLHGPLRALDAIAPYRLEMSAKLAVDGARDLYAFFGDRIARVAGVRAFAAAPTGARAVIVNVASEEYAAAVLRHADALGGARVVHVRFPGAAVHAKAARGAIVRFAARTRAARVEDLRAFTGAHGEWRFDARTSTEDELVFARAAMAGKRKRGSGEG